MKELTSGNFGGFFWYQYCFTLILTDSEIIVLVPFRSYTIPLSHIEKISAEKPYKRLPWPTERLRIVHNYPAAPKNIFFISTDWNAWLDAFDKKGILIEDSVGIRNASTSYWKWAKKFNLFCYYLSVAIAVTAVLMLIVSRLTLT